MSVPESKTFWPKTQVKSHKAQSFWICALREHIGTGPGDGQGMCRLAALAFVISYPPSWIQFISVGQHKLVGNIVGTGLSSPIAAARAYPTETSSSQHSRQDAVEAVLALLCQDRGTWVGWGCKHATGLVFVHLFKMAAGGENHCKGPSIAVQFLTPPHRQF